MRQSHSAGRRCGDVRREQAQDMGNNNPLEMSESRRQRGAPRDHLLPRLGTDILDHKEGPMGGVSLNFSLPTAPPNLHKLDRFISVLC